MITTQTLLPASRLRFECRRRAYTLIEMAIVLGIAAIIISIIWSVIQPIQDYNRQQQVVAEINQLMPNFRATTQTNIWAADAGYIRDTDFNVNYQTIPPFMQRAGGCGGFACADGPWGAGNPAIANGTFRVCGWKAASTACVATINPIITVQLIAVELANLTNANCAGVVQAVTTPGAGPSGLVDVSINGITMRAAATSIQPVPVATAIADCVAGNNLNIVDFVYRASAGAF